MGGKYLIADAFREENWRFETVIYFGGEGEGGIESISSLSLSLGTRIVAEERAGLALEIFLASSIYSPPRCSFYTTFFRYRFCVGKGEEEGIRQ